MVYTFTVHMLHNEKYNFYYFSRQSDLDKPMYSFVVSGGSKKSEVPVHTCNHTAQCFPLTVNILLFFVLSRLGELLRKSVGGHLIYDNRLLQLYYIQLFKTIDNHA